MREKRTIFATFVDWAGGQRPGSPWRAGDGAFLATAAGIVAVWFYAFPMAPALRWLDVAFDSLVLATAAVALVYVRAFRYPTLELAWKVLILSHLVCLLDCFTVESRNASTVIVIAVYASETIMILAILWGFQRYQSRRAAQERRLRRARQKSRQSELRYAELVNAVEGIVWEADPVTFRFQFVSRQAERLLGYPVGQWYEEADFWVKKLHPEDRDRAVSYCIEESRHRRPHEMEYRMIAADGRTVWLRDLVNSVKQKDGSWRLCGVMFVITETKELEERLRHSASHDALTGLPNRDTLLARLRRAHESNAADPHHALFFLDIDRFKIVNDSLGHHYGDRLLMDIARRLSDFVGPQDTVARLGGDEFAVLLDSVRDGAEACEIAERMQAVVSKPLDVAGRRLEPSVSIGIVLGRQDCEDVQDLLRDADTAMYQAKASQRGSARLFDIEMRRRLMNHIKVEADLKRGLSAGELRVFFQPIVDLSTLNADGFEALTRWLHPSHGVVPAAEFMPVAVESEMGVHLAWNAVELTFQHATRWARRFDSPFRLFANVSGKQFLQSDFLAHIERLLRASDTDPRKIFLEITEDVVVEDIVTEQKLQELKRMGFALALDDFGVGRSSLNRLCTLPFDLIKVDRSFIQSLERGESQVLVRAIKTVAEDLGMEVVAEGVETEGQRAWLIDLGFRLGQGYLFDQALPPEELERRFASRPDPVAAG